MKSPPTRFFPAAAASSSISDAAQHQQDYGRPPPAYSFISGQVGSLSDGRKERVLSRGSWGSWSAGGGSSSYVAGGNVGIGGGAGVGELAQTEIREDSEGKDGDGDSGGGTGSRRVSEGGEVVGMEGKGTSGGSGMAGMRADSIGGRI
jgi:hypothetical protein